MSVNNNQGPWLGWDPTEPPTSPRNLPSRAPNNELGRDAFLMLLMTQLQFQDPLNPMENHEFVAQMAQFSALEQMQSMNQSVQMQQANSMLGRWVEGSFFNGAQGAWNEVAGFVESVVMQGGEAHLRIGDDLLPASRVNRVYPDLFLESMANLSRDIVVAQNISIMGRHIMAVRMEGPQNDRRPVEFIEGVVTGMRFDEHGRPVLMVGSREVLPGEIFSVAGAMRLTDQHIYVPSQAADSTPATFTQRQIQGVRFERVGTPPEDRIYLEFVEGPGVLIESVSMVADSLGYIGQTIRYGNISGQVESVRIIGGVPQLQVRDSADVLHSVNFNLFRNRTS